VCRRSRGADRPSFAKSFALQLRGRRECRVLAAPAVSCAIVRRKTHTSIQVQSEHSGIPCAVVLRLMPCSPRRRIPLASVAAGLKAKRIPVGLRKTSGGLTPATGARTTRFCRPQQCFRLARGVRSRKHPPCEHLARPALPRPPHPAPTSVTIAIRPSSGTGWPGFYF